jgi:Flp pilus assembly pilin Flp
MPRAVLAIAKLVRAEEGQDLLEYGVLVALIALVAVLAVDSFGGAVNNIFWGPIAGAF